VGPDYTWQNGRETEIRTTCHIIKLICRNETEENVISVSGFLTLLGKKGVYSLLQHCERSGIAWFRLEIWKLKGIMGGTERGRCLLRAEEDSESRLLLKSPEAQRW
jgi:hypothetical protein